MIIKQWKITYYNNKVYEALLDWPPKLLGKYLKMADLMEIHGADLGMPLTRALGDGLFEIRIKAQEGIGRAFFCTLVGKEIVILHTLIKKTQLTPEKDLDIARKRLKEIKHHGKTHS